MKNGYYNTDVDKLFLEELKEIATHQNVKPLKLSQLVELIQCKTKKTLFKKLNKFIEKSKII